MSGTSSVDRISNICFKSANVTHAVTVYTRLYRVNNHRTSQPQKQT